MLTAIKEWSNHPDTVLSFLCQGIINRNLLKIKYTTTPLPANLLTEKVQQAAYKLQVTTEDAQWLVFTGEVSTNTYNFADENIFILFKDGTVKDISAVDDPLINENLMGSTKKYYICYMR